MYKKLVRYDRWHFLEVDPVCLRRCAIALKAQIVDKVNKAHDTYGFYTKTMPIVESAIRGEISESMDLDVIPFISANYYHDKREGLLPRVYDSDFTRAIADFSVTLQGLSLEKTDKFVKDGITYALLDFEEEGDWPDKVKYK